MTTISPSIEFRIDSRERSFIDAQPSEWSPQISTTVESLDVGDFWIKIGSMTYIYERKTLEDAVASVKDGRYKEQKSRLLAARATMDPCVVYYILEGFPSGFFGTSTRAVGGLNIDVLRSFWLHSMYRDDIRIVSLKNIQETVGFFQGVLTRMVKHPDYFQGGIQTPQLCLTGGIHVKKKDNYNSPETVLIRQLTMLEGVGEKQAKDLRDHLKVSTMADFMKQIETLETEEEKIKWLTGVPKIGHKKALSILRGLGFICKLNSE